MHFIYSFFQHTLKIISMSKTVRYNQLYISGKRCISSGSSFTLSTNIYQHFPDASPYAGRWGQIDTQYKVLALMELTFW